MQLTKQHRKTKKIQKGRELVQKTWLDNLREQKERERETMKQSPQGQKLNICTYTKVNIYIFYIEPILSIYLH